MRNPRGGSRAFAPALAALLAAGAAAAYVFKAAHPVEDKTVAPAARPSEQRAAPGKTTKR